MLTNLAQVVTLSEEALRRGNQEARVQGVVTYVPPQGTRLYLQEGAHAIYADFTNSVAAYRPGDRVELAGPVRRGFLVPRMLLVEIRLLDRSPLPEAKPAEPARLAAGEDAMQFVSVRGTVRDMMMLAGPHLMLLVSEGGVSYRIHAPMPQGSALPREWLEAEIEARGMARPISDNYGNAFGFILYQSGTNFTTIRRPGISNLFDRPLVSLREAMASTNATNLRLKFAGTVLAHVPGRTLFLQDGDRVARIRLLPPLPKTLDEAQYLEHEAQTQLQPGEPVEVLGVREDGFALAPSFGDGEFRRIGKATIPPVPQPISARDLEAGRFAGRLVTLKARLLDQRATSSANIWHQWLVFEADGLVFQARWESESPAPWTLQPDSYLQITGVNDVESGRLRKARSFHLVLRSPADVVPAAAPPFWTRPDAVRVALIALGLVALTGAWIAYERRHIRRLRAADELAKRSEAVTRTINYFATSLLEQHTEDDILWDLAKNCISQFGFVDCVVYLLDPEREVLVQKAALGAKSPAGRVIVNPIALPLGKGIVGSVAASGKAELIGDTSRDPRYVVDDQQRLSEITVPIIADGTVIGVIDSEHPQRNFFTPEHLKMLTAIASLCANKLVRARAELKLRESHRNLEQRIAERAGELLRANERLTREVGERARAEKVQRALYAISEAIHSVEDIPSLYQRIHEIIGTLMPAQNFYIALHEAATDTVNFPYHRDEMDPPPPARKARRGMTEYVLRTGRAALADLDEIRRLKEAGEYVQSGAPAKIWLGVPLSSGGRPFGVMAVQDHHNERVYGEEEKQILSFVAGQTALAIERKRAASELLDANRQLKREVADRTRAEQVQRALFAISEAIHTVQDLPSLYARIHEIVGTLMPAANFFIGLQDATTKVVSFPYWRDELEPAPPLPRQHGRGLTEYVLNAGRAMLISAAENARLIACGECEQHGLISKIWLGVPLSTGGRPFGVMVLQDHHDAQVYGEEEKHILGFVAAQIAVAIERKRAESDLRTALAAEKELNQLKSSFVSMVSHEFRTPLEVILSSSNILDRYLDRLPPEKRAAQLRAIRKSVHRMNDLIDDVLLLGKFDAGALCCQPVPLDLAAFCRRAAREIESATARDGAIQFTTGEGNGEATADEGLLQHILTNLLGNAVKYSPADRIVEFELHRHGPDAEFVIRDHGCGIPAADQARLFTAFYRGSNVGQTSGSGLGLVIAKRCVDLHGGTIRCESQQGLGTTFTVTLPLFDGTRIFRRRQNGASEPPPLQRHPDL